MWVLGVRLEAGAPVMHHPLEGAVTAYAASTRSEDPGIALAYLAASKMLAIQAREKLQNLEMLIGARERELLRCAELRARGLEP